jgi:hypothetical protein
VANISDLAGIVTGSTLELFNEMERLVLRDGDVAYAALIMQDAMRKVCATTQPGHAARTGSAATRRSP